MYRSPIVWRVSFISPTLKKHRNPSFGRVGTIFVMLGLQKGVIFTMTGMQENSMMWKLSSISAMLEVQGRRKRTNFVILKLQRGSSTTFVVWRVSSISTVMGEKRSSMVAMLEHISTIFTMMGMQDGSIVWRVSSMYTMLGVQRPSMIAVLGLQRGATCTIFTIVGMQNSYMVWRLNSISPVLGVHRSSIVRQEGSNISDMLGLQEGVISVMLGMQRSSIVLLKKSSAILGL